MKTFKFTHIKGGIGSSHRGFLEHIPRTLGVINTNSIVEQVQKKMIQFTKGIIYPWKGSQGY